MLQGFILAVILITGCNIRVIPKEEEQSEVHFAIISEECIPESLGKLLEERKEKEIKLTYVDQNKRYIVIGYWKQEGGGYSIYIKELYKTKNAIYVDTCLMGPEVAEKKKEIASYPRIVLQVSEMGLPVVFK